MTDRLLRVWLSFCMTLSAAWVSAVEPVKVACVGNSVTYGMRVENREHNCYPARLAQLLGEGYDVRNFGKSGATLLSRGHRPYVEQPTLSPLRAMWWSYIWGSTTPTRATGLITETILCVIICGL